MTRRNVFDKKLSNVRDSLSCQGEKGAAAGGYPTWASMAIQLHQGQWKLVFMTVNPLELIFLGCNEAYVFYSKGNAFKERFN